VKHRRSNLRPLWGAIAASVILLSSCGSDESAPDESGAPSTDANEVASGDEQEVLEVQQGGESSVVQPIDAATLDPTTVINSPSQGSTALNAIYDVLFTMSDDGNFSPGLATDFSTSDGTTWTMTLRDGVQFSDGTPFDADAVAQQWQRSKDNIRSSGWAHLQNALEMAVVDELTFEVTFDAPNHHFDQTVPWTSLVWIPSPTAMTAAGDNFGNAPVGAGPFVLESRIPSAETVLVRNPDYWDAPLPHLDVLTIRTIPDPQQGFDSVVTGGADAYVTLADQWAVQAEDNGLTRFGIEQIGGSGFLFGTTRPPFDDPLAREAVYLAVDRTQLNEMAADGAWTVPDTLFPEGSRFHSDDATFPEHDPERAQDLLDQLADSGNAVEFTISTTEGEAQARAVALQTLLSQYDNLDVAVETLPGASYGTTLYTGDFDMAIYGFGGTDPEPAVATMRTDHPLPIATMGSAEIDEAVRAGREATDDAGREDAYGSLTRAFNELHMMLFTGRNHNWVAMREDVSGAEMYGQGSVVLTRYGRVD
jgi:peptide/nickel transport system substrate-binding protein